MKNREELYTAIYEEETVEDSPTAIQTAVDLTTESVLEYIDDELAKWDHYAVMGKVLNTLRANVSQFVSPR